MRKLCILTALTLKVNLSSLFKLIDTFALMFGSPITRVLSSVTAIALLLIDFSNVLSVEFRPLQRLRWVLLRKYLAVLPVIYCHKRLYVTCFEDSVIHL